MSVINLDCRAGLAVFPGVFDAAIADPPYGDTSLGWDWRVEEWLQAVAGALKPNAHLWVFGSMRFLAPLFAEVEALGFKYSQDIVWEKQNGTGFHNDRFRRVHEHAVLFYRGAWGDTYHEAQHTADGRKTVIRRKTRALHWGELDGATYTSEDGGPRLMRSVLQVRNEHGRAIHPTQKPLDLLRPMIRYSVPPGGSVCVPFSGSAAVEVAAKLEGRRYVGFETKAEYAALGNARLAEAAKCQ